MLTSDRDRDAAEGMWSLRQAEQRSGAMAPVPRHHGAIHVGILNNMPDGAILQTERQFSFLLSRAAGNIEVKVTYYTLPEIVRTGAIHDYVLQRYESIESLWHDPPDAVVVTGTEPHTPDMRNELYWESLTGVFEWLDQRGIPAMFSCLAAHAAVLHMDRIPRSPLGYKCFGVYQETALPHPLMDGVRAEFWHPHSRWNEVREADLVRNGYQILSRSQQAGVGFFARQRKSLWLFCQGHPEYDGLNLLLEYRRDVGRFLSGERNTYPELPNGYLSDAATRMLAAFKERALRSHDIGLMAAFPRINQQHPTWDAWRTAGQRVLGNWLRVVAGCRVPAVPTAKAVALAGSQPAAE